MVNAAWKRNTWIVYFVLLAGGIVALDLWSKEAVFELLEVVSVGDPPEVASQKPFVVIEDYFWLEANYNYGAFSGWFSGHTGYLAAVSVIAAAVLAGLFVFHVVRHAQPCALYVTALALLLGGTIGNLYDRAMLRAVRDWIRWFYVSSDGKHHVWPNFNVADSAIVGGVGCLVLLELIRWRKEKRESRAGAETQRE